MRFLFALPLFAALLLQACSSGESQALVTAEDRFREGMREFHDESYLEALQHFDIIRLQYPGSSVADSARYFSGMSRFKREEYILASYEFNQLITSYPQSKLLADAQYMFAECYYELSPKVQLDQSKTTKAIDALQTFIEYYPKHPKLKEAETQLRELYNKLAQKEYLTGVLYTKMENIRSALIYFDTVIDKYYSTDYYDDALLMKIRVLMKRKRYGEAAPVIREFLEKQPDSPFRPEVMNFFNELPSQFTPSSYRDQG